MKNTFRAMNLHPELMQAIDELGYTEPTPIQTAVIPLLMDGKDVIGQAQTGTGKTAAFALPLLHALNGRRKIHALVVTPTRELALQDAKATYEYGQHHGVRVLAVYGGQPYGRQITRLKKGVDIVVGTPGRLLDLIKKNAIDLSEVSTVVLDEADEMLSMGFIEDIEAILESTPVERQTALFSATMPRAIRQLASRYMHDPQEIIIEQEQLTVAAIEQRAILVHQNDKLSALTRLLEMEEISQALVFVRTRAQTGSISNALVSRGFQAEPLSGDLSQETREQVLNRFRQQQIQVLIATDVAARGLDIDDISHVFNYDLPLDPEVYVHRIGRTGRAGKTGISITLLSPNEYSRLRKIEHIAGTKIAQVEIPTPDAILERREEQLLERMRVWLRRSRFQRESEIIQTLVDEGHNPLDLAAAALKMARSEEKQRPIGNVRKMHGRKMSSTATSHKLVERESRGRADGPSHETGMVRMRLNKGKDDGIRPNDVVGAIASCAEIPGHSIGRITIKEKQTFVDIPDDSAAKVLAKSGNYIIHRQRINIVRS
ncbi:MAG: DEAD/DEAH box helicase [Anaerolineales bacterium]|nr:DEAD/DEAH box helicase [Anaerolineales bacterium]